MSTDQDAAARRIMDQFGEESRIPYLNIEEGDVGMLIAFPIIGLFIAGLTGINSPIMGKAMSMPTSPSSILRYGMRLSSPN